MGKEFEAGRNLETAVRNYSKKSARNFNKYCMMAGPHSTTARKKSI